MRTVGLFIAATPGRLFGGFRRYGDPLKKMGAELMGMFRDDPNFWRFHAEEVSIKCRHNNDPEACSAGNRG
jgi:hypothetical protein